MKESQKELLIELYNDLYLTHYADKLKQGFPELFEKEEFKQGEWIVRDFGYTENIICYGTNYGFWNGEWRDDLNTNYQPSPNTRPATPEEVEQALIKEAKRRGVWNVPIIDVNGNKQTEDCYAIVWDGDTFWSNYGMAFRDGKWAEPLQKEMTIEEIERELGYNIIIKIKNDPKHHRIKR